MCLTVMKRMSWMHCTSTLFLFTGILSFVATSNLTTELVVRSTCRTIVNNSPIFCPVEDFAWLTRLSCYIHNQAIPEAKKFVTCDKSLLQLQLNCTHVSLCRQHVLENGTIVHVLLSPEAYNLSDPTSEIYKTFTKQRDIDQFHLCCQKAVECCSSMLSKPSTPKGIRVCPRTWDGWQCFDDTPVNQSFEAVCPEHVDFEGECSVFHVVTIKRPCLHPGYWPLMPMLEWTNYSACAAKDSTTRRHYTHIGAYCVSLLALVPALFIFFSYKQLRVPRITMHKNLFISIFINGVVFVTFKYLLILKPLVSSDLPVKEGTVECKFLYVLTKYTRSSNYMWMFCEGLYLHKLIVAAFAEQKNLIIYYLIGWGFPVIPVFIYSVLMLFYSAGSSGCWYAPTEGYEWVFHVPNLLSLALNFVFLCNIIRVLVIKLRATNTNEPSQYKKAVRATFVLVPLFGVHFVITSYAPPKGECTWLNAYFYLNYLLDGLQGFLVALIFCYFNGEVHGLIKRSFKRWRLQRDPRCLRGHSTATQIMTMSEIVTRDHSTRSSRDSSPNKPRVNGKVD